MASEVWSDDGSDRALVIAFQDGDEAAYDEIFKRYHGRVEAVCRRMLPTAQDAEEAAQETFLKAYVALTRFNGSFYLGAWLSRIATNVCVDHLRSKSRSNLVALPEDQDDLITEQGPEDLVVGAHPRLVKAIQGIQPLHASALALRALEGMSHQEIGRRLDMTPTQVKALLHRARSSLRKAWDKAEGWALAPVIGLRYLINDRAAADAGRLASFTPSAGPFLMEKVAATAAIVVAAALTGLPSAPEGPATPPPRRKPAVAAPAAVKVQFPPRDEAPVAAAEKRARSYVEAPPAPETMTAPVALDETPATDLAAGLTRGVRKTLQDGGGSPKEGARKESKNESPVGPTAAEADKVVKRVRKTVTAVQDAVAP